MRATGRYIIIISREIGVRMAAREVAGFRMECKLHIRHVLLVDEGNAGVVRVQQGREVMPVE